MKKGPVFFTKISIVLGLTGPNAAGKGEICKYLATKGYYVTSLSDILRKIAVEKNISLSRINLVNLGNELREKYGAGVLAKWLIKELSKNHNKSYVKVVVDSIRNIQEVKEFRKKFKSRFFLVYVDAPKKLRFKFMKLRNRESDPKTYKEFLKVEKKEKSDKLTHQQIHKCKKLKNFLIYNNSTLEELHKKIDKILQKVNHYGRE